MEKENPQSLSEAHQKHAAFIASRGWKSRNSSPLSVEGEVFSLTFPFIEQVLMGDLGCFAVTEFIERSSNTVDEVELLAFATNGVSGTRGRNLRSNRAND